jgi:hypothetical protein
MAVITERRAHQRQRQAAGRLAAGWWAAVMVAGLAVAPEVMRHRVSSGGWHTALQPTRG